ncbi:Calx-beta domain-containing protein [Couchioplanes azureus]|uniref:Calx-beta domain-containing protein n=1 Tax=Couchioplanes caeruleus TaxID=56438 RepID=UPI00166FCDAB|nr:Calx-beta domain-containing protein [Couchioplanes caeruleus]GGQ55886.1 hypothetical protein GCM10010166_26580 [Couchioplanes caeruleus subsp. azureus]
MRYLPAHAAKSGSVPFMLRGPKSVRTVLSAAVAGAIAFAPAVFITAPAEAAITDFTIVDATLSADEGEDIVFEVKRAEKQASYATKTDITWTLTGGTADGEATADSDFTDDTGTLSFPADTTADGDGNYGGDSLFITVKTLQDTTDEPAESFDLTLTAGAETDTATGTITDDDAAPGYTLIVSDPSPAEDLSAGEVTVTAELDEPSGKAVTIPLSTVAGTAKAGQDYTTTTDSITIPVGATTTVDEVTIPIEDDPLYEESQQTFQVKGGTSTTVTGTETETVTIQDDEEQSKITIGADTVGEPDTLAFPVTLSPASERAVTAAWTTADGPGADEADWEDGIAKAGTDYTAGSGTVTFPAATSNAPAAGATAQTISVRTVSDTIAEETEAMHVTLSNPTVGVLDDETEATGTITDNDPPPTATLTPTAAITEGSSGKVTKTYTVKLSKQSGREVTVDYEVAASGATPATDVADFFEKADTLTFAPGETTKTFTVDIVGDTMDEPNETFSIALSASGADVSGNGVAGTVEYTITDDDDAPTFSVAPIIMNEGDAGSVAVFPIKLSNASYQDTTFTLTGTGGSATDAVVGNPAGDIDFLEPTDPITIPAGQTTGYLFYLVNGDEVFEPDETVSIELTPSANVDGDPTDADLTIKNDDEMPSFEVTSVTGNEGETVNVMGFVTGVAQSDTTFNINFAGASVNGSTAASTDDFTNPGTVSVVVTGGTLSGAPKVIKGIKLADDATPEGPETILASGNAVNGTVVNGVVTIAASDGGTTPPAGNTPTLKAAAPYRLGVGSLELTGTAAAGATVTLWGTPVGSDVNGTWENLGTATATGGAYEFHPEFTTTGWWFRTTVGDAQSNTIKVNLKQSPDFFARSSSRGTATLSVFGDPRVAGLSVRLLRANRGGTWSTVASGTLDANGKFVKTLTGLRSGSSVYFKALVLGDGDVGMLTNYSNGARVTVR